MQVLPRLPMPTHFYLYLAGKLILEVCIKLTRKTILHTISSAYARSFSNILHIYPPLDHHNIYVMQKPVFKKFTNNPRQLAGIGFRLPLKTFKEYFESACLLALPHLFSFCVCRCFRTDERILESFNLCSFFMSSFFSRRQRVDTILTAYCLAKWTVV